MLKNAQEQQLMNTLYRTKIIYRTKLLQNL